MATKWTRGAQGDLRDLVRFIHREKPSAAKHMAVRIKQMVREAADVPELGRMVPEFGNPAIRERIVRPYRVVYLVEERGITVLGIVHGRRLMPEHIKDK
jgi:plasmid stabilization system protein ParE